MKTYYHGSEYPIEQIRKQPMFFTDSEEFAKSLEWLGVEGEKMNRYVYSAELDIKNPHIITSEEEYEERMMDFPCFENDEDALICPAEGKSPEYVVVKDAVEQVKNFKLVKHVFESMNERLEKLDNCFITSSPYDIVNLFKNKPKEYRVLYDKNIDMYMIGEAESVTHYDMINRAMKDAYYYNMEDFIDELGGTVDNYTEIGQSGFWDGDTEEENIEPYLWYIVFSPNDEWTLGTDGYDKRYDYPFGHVFTRGCGLDEIGLWNALGVPQETEKLNEEAYDYANLPLEDGEVFSNSIEIMIFSPNDNVQRLRQFMEDKTMVRCIIDKDMYLWNAELATHGGMINFLKRKYGCKYTYGNAFMFGKRTIDPTSLYDIKNHPEDIKEFLENYNYIKTLLGIDYLQNQTNLEYIKDLYKQQKESLIESSFNDAFWNWFGKSKLIENGKPMVFYHRSDDTFNTFDINQVTKQLLIDGFCFSPKPLSSEYGKNIMKVYLKAEKPYTINNLDDIDEVVRFTKDFEIWFREKPEDIKEFVFKNSSNYSTRADRSFDGKSALRCVIKELGTHEIMKRFLNKGYDCLIIKNSSGGIKKEIHFDEYIVFYPNQIKAVDNKGTWSITSGNIYESLNKELERYL